MNTDRDRILKELGYSTYQHYVLGGEWREIRKKAIAYSGGRCSRCGVDGFVHVHHASYLPENMKVGKSIRRFWWSRENEGLNPIPDLWVLCADCHKALHSCLSSWSPGNEELRRVTYEFLGFDAPPVDRIEKVKPKKKRKKWKPRKRKKKYRPLETPEFKVGKPRVRRKKDDE